MQHILDMPRYRLLWGNIVVYNTFFGLIKSHLDVALLLKIMVRTNVLIDVVQNRKSIVDPIIIYDDRCSLVQRLLRMDNGNTPRVLWEITFLQLSLVVGGTLPQPNWLLFSMVDNRDMCNMEICTWSLCFYQFFKTIMANLRNFCTFSWCLNHSTQRISPKKCLSFMMSNTIAKGLNWHLCVEHIHLCTWYFAK